MRQRFGAKEIRVHRGRSRRRVDSVAQKRKRGAVIVMTAWSTPIMFFKAALSLAIMGLTAGFLAGCSQLPKLDNASTVVFSAEPVELQAKLYLPDRPGASVAAVVVVHGGSWVRRSGDMDAISRRLAKAGFAAFNISYRSAAQYPYPAAVEDVREAIAWLQRNADRYGIDPDRIGGWGYSAGGQLILRAALDPDIGLSAIVSGGTPARFSYWPESPIITRFIGASYEEKPAIWEDASPVNHVQNGSPPVFLYHGAKDTLVDAIQMDFMEEALRQNGVPVQTRLLETKGHVGTYLFAGEIETQAIAFLHTWLVDTPASSSGPWGSK
jgi:acetyl esterase/lipase